MTCFACQSAHLTEFLNLGHHPPSDSFLMPELAEREEARYPLRVFFCADCFLVQLGYAVDPETLFRNFVYTTGANNSLVANFKELVDTAVARFGLSRNDFAIDIGSNDGTLLKNYLPYGISVLGVDPAVAVAAIAEGAGIPTKTDFFNRRAAREIVSSHGSAAVITATNVFAHVRDLDDLVLAIGDALAPDGVFISESHYLLDLVQKLQYDAIYLEHLRYYSLRPLELLFRRFGMELFDAERVPTHGGSIRVYAGRAGAHPVSARVADLIAAEEAAGLYREETFAAFASRVRVNKIALHGMIADAKRAGSRIAGIGAPAKGNTLLNYCGLDADMVDYLVEKSPMKIGRLAPGSHIPIVEESRLFTDQPEIAILLSWNIADELVPKIRAGGFRGRFLIPNPEVRMV